MLKRTISFISFLTNKLENKKQFCKQDIEIVKLHILQLKALHVYTEKIVKNYFRKNYYKLSITCIYKFHDASLIFSNFSPSVL